jgi:peptide/nickel transport system ATP-binding protein
VTLLSVEALAVDIRGTPVLRDVSLACDRGEVLGVIGESGSGKSMTALAIMGLLPAGARARGRVALGGEDLLAKAERALCAVRGREIGMIFQEPMTALNPVHTIGAQVAEAFRVHRRAGRREAVARARETLARVGLDRVPPSRYPHELSGGQRQRVVIAMAVALQPRLLVADEPTTALDVTTQAQILALLRRLVGEDGMGLVLVSHDLAVVADLAGRLAIMHDGAVLETGPTQAVLRRPEHPYTRALLRAAALPPRKRPPAARRPLLEVDGAVRAYPAPAGRWLGRGEPVRAVRGVSFTLHEGESLGLVGESGCGKSTLTRAILGLEPLQGGRIRLDGEAVMAEAGLPGRLRAKMQAVFQDPYGSFNPRHRVARLVAEPFHLSDDPPRGAARREAVVEALETVVLRAEDAERYIHEFSGGQRQRIAIARALILRPKLIILDEAVSALDVQVRARILDLLGALSRRLELSFLFVSHDLGVVRAITDRVLVMKDGLIVEEGPTGAIFAQPRHPYTRALLAAVPRLEVAG